MRFANREEAGRLLASRLQFLEDEIVVLGLTPSGIPVAFEVARELGAPLDLVVTHRIRAVGRPEMAIGAIAEGGVMYLNPTLLRDGHVTHEEALALAEDGVAELAARMRLYRGAIPAPSLAKRTVIVVDDFVLTGTAARAAARAARRRGASRVLLAVPVLAAAVEAELLQDFNALIRLEVAAGPEPLSSYYERLEEISDVEAVSYLRRAIAPLTAVKTPAPFPS